MQVVVWILIILLILFLIWLLRRWIKRLIFIIILLALAFLIYGIFNPSGAARLWYNVRTFPQRVTSWMSSGKEFLDYDSYKLNLSSIGDDIGDKIDLDDYENEDVIDLDDIELSEDEEMKNVKDHIIGAKEEEDEENIYSQSEDKRAIKAFPRSVKLVEFSQLTEKNVYDVDEHLTGYSKSDLLKVISKYVEKNLDDDTDILVTVEYGDDDTSPQRVVLETRPRVSGKGQIIYFSGGILDDSFEENDGRNIDKSDENLQSGDSGKNSNNQVKNNIKSSQKSVSTKLTQKEVKDAEEIFSILF